MNSTLIGTVTLSALSAGSMAFYGFMRVAILSGFVNPLSQLIGLGGE
jgi:hypothetical protein